MLNPVDPKRKVPDRLVDEKCREAPLGICPPGACAHLILSVPSCIWIMWLSLDIDSSLPDESHSQHEDSSDQDLDEEHRIGGSRHRFGDGS